MKNKDLKIARELVKIAKSLVAEDNVANQYGFDFEKYDYVSTILFPKEKKFYLSHHRNNILFSFPDYWGNFKDSYPVPFATMFYFPKGKIPRDLLDRETITNEEEFQEFASCYYGSCILRNYQKNLNHH